MSYNPSGPKSDARDELCIISEFILRYNMRACLFFLFVLITTLW